MSQLDDWIRIVPFWNSLCFDDTTIGVADTERFLAYAPGKTFGLGIEVGDLIKPGSITHRTLTSGQRQLAFVPQEVFGVPTIAIGLPLYEDGRLIGCVSTAVTQAKHHALQQDAEMLSAATQELSATSEELFAASSNISQMISLLNHQALGLQQYVHQIQEVTDVVTNLSSSTKLLGLNARIEAARAGEVGRGFGVVAEEIQRLAEFTRKSTDSIQSTIQQVIRAISEFSTSTSSIQNSSEEQLQAIEQLSQMAVHLSERAESLTQLAQISTTA